MAVKNTISWNLKPLNSKAEKIFFKIIADIPTNAAKYIGEVKDAFMRVVVEEIYHPCSYGKVYSIGHYFQQNGDRMSDPEMTFLVNYADGRVYPLSYELSSLGIFQRNCQFDDKGELKGIYKKLTNQHKNFANTWMNNIQDQQNI